MRIWLAIPIALLAACGNPDEGPDPRAVLAVLDARVGVLSPELKLHWMQTGLDPLRSGLREIQQGTALGSLGENEAARRAIAAAVILVADLHDLDPCRRAIARAVRALVTPSTRSEGRVAIGLESVPLTMETDVREARQQPIDGGFDPLTHLLESAWTWPVLATTALLRDRDLATCPLLAVGRKPNAVFPLQNTPDAERKPGIDLSRRVSIQDWKYGADFVRRNENALARVGQWLRAAPQRKAFVLYGTAHLLGKGNLVERFRSEGYEVLVLVPFIPEWEAALRRRFGSEAAQSWYEILPGVLRPPFVSDADVIALGLPQESATELQIPQPGG